MAEETGGKFAHFTSSGVQFSPSDGGDAESTVALWALPPLECLTGAYKKGSRSCQDQIHLSPAEGEETEEVWSLCGRLDGLLPSLIRLIS